MDTAWQFIRYSTVGFFSNLLLYVAYLLVTGFGAGHKTSMTLLYAVGVLLTFLFNRRWTFDHHGQLSGTFIRYVVIYGIGYLVNLAGLFLFVDRLMFPHQLVQGILVVIVALLLFSLQKLWVFGSKSKTSSKVTVLK